MKRPRGCVAIFLSAVHCALSGRTEHVPTHLEFPDTVVRRVTIKAGGDLPWKLSALWTPRDEPPPWKIVVITGAPSWAEYWAPAMAALGQDRELIAVDRPGFANSEPNHCVPKIETQAKALLPLLDAAPGQRILLVGQSYGAAIATLMAAERPGQVGALVLMSGFFGKPGPTARLWMTVGRWLQAFIPKDLRHAVLETSGQARQLNPVFKLLNRHPFLTTIIHGDLDDFAPIEVARGIADITLAPSRFIEVQGANHFLNDLTPEQLVACLETAIDPRGALRKVVSVNGEEARESPRSAA